MTPYWQVDNTRRCLYLAVDQGKVSLFHLALLKLAAEAFVGHVGFCYEHGPGGVLVQPVDDTRPKLPPNARQIPAMMEKGVYQGSGAVARAGVYDEAGGFVQDDDMAVFVQDRQRDRFRRAIDGLWRWGFSPDNVTAFDHVSGLLRQTIDCDVPCPNQSAGVGAGEGGKAPCYHHVQPAPCF